MVKGKRTVRYKENPLDDYYGNIHTGMYTPYIKENDESFKRGTEKKNCQTYTELPKIPH